MPHAAICWCNTIGEDLYEIVYSFNAARGNLLVQFNLIPLKKKSIPSFNAARGNLLVQYCYGEKSTQDLHVSMPHAAICWCNPSHCEC